MRAVGLMFEGGVEGVELGFVCCLRGWLYATPSMRLSTLTVDDAASLLTQESNCYVTKPRRVIYFLFSIVHSR